MSSETESTDEKPKGGKLKKILISLVVGLVLIGGGAAGGFFAGDFLGDGESPKEDPNKPKLVFKEGVEPAKNLTTGETTDSKSDVDTSSLQATYYPIEQPFTSNLKGSSSFAQMSLAVSTHFDERVLTNIEDHETAIRSAILLTIADQDVETLSSKQGKRVLQGLLTTAINDVLKEKASFGGIDNVYFTSFVVQ